MGVTQMRLFVYLSFFMIFLTYPLLNYASNDNFDNYFEKGNEHFNNGQYEQAINAYKKSLSIYSEHADANYFLALAYYQKYTILNNKRLETDINKMYNDPKNYGSFSKENPETTAEKKAYDLYVKHLKKAIQIDDKIPGPHYYLGTHYLRGQLYDKAEEQFKKEIQLNPDSGSSYLMIGNIYKGRSEFNNAIKYYEKALSIKPDSENVHYKLALIYNKLGMRDKVLKEYQYLKSKKSVFAESLELHLNISQSGPGATGMK